MKKEEVLELAKLYEWVFTKVEGTYVSLKRNDETIWIGNRFIEFSWEPVAIDFITFNRKSIEKLLM